MVTRMTLRKVKYLPTVLEAGILYVSEEYAVAGHLCACGCGNKVITPLGPAEWSVRSRNGYPTLHPSVGNWQLSCRSHYFIQEGRIRWMAEWSESQIANGRRAEDARREAHYASRGPESFWQRSLRWIRLRIRK